MLTIDADAHVIECEKTWDYLEGDDKRYRPVAIAVDMPTGKTQNFWIIGGRLIGGRDNIGQDTARESREMANIDSRLQHMDVIGDDRLREYTHRASSRRSRDAIRHTSHIFLSDARLTSVGMPGDVSVECELSMSGFAHRPSPSRPTPRPCRGVTRPNTLGVDRPPGPCPPGF